MCKNSKRKLFAFSIILVLALVQLAAWPTWLTGPVPDKEVVEKVVEKVVRIPADSQETLDQIESMRQLVKQLEAQIESAKISQEESQMIIEELSLSLSLSEQKIESLQNTLELQSELQIASEESSKALKKDYDKLLSTKQPATFKGIVGANVTYNPQNDHRLGIGIDLGFGYDRWAIIGGVQYAPSKISFLTFETSALTYKVGLQYTF